MTMVSSEASTTRAPRAALGIGRARRRVRVVWRRARRASRRHPRAASVTVALLLLVLVNVVLQTQRRALDLASDDFWGLRRVQQCESLGRAPDVLYLGSSRTVYGVDAALIDARDQQRGAETLGCNAATVGSTLEQDYYTLKRMIEDGKAPRLVVETLWEWNLNTQAARPADDAVDHFEQVLRLADLGDLPQLKERFGSGANDSSSAVDFALGKLVPMYGDRTGILRRLCGPARVGPCGENTSRLDPVMQRLYPTAHRQGWLPAPSQPISSLSSDELAQAEHSWTYLHDQVKDFTIGGAQPGYLERLLALARAHHIQVALVMTPLDSMYFSYFDSPADWPRIVAYWRAVAERAGVPLYDESHDASFTHQDFADPQHLSVHGALRFSNWLADHVVGPTLHPTTTALRR
ncbi:MAG TPA: hypothetical protein VFY89_04105 [Ktedonobacterales bacterium]